MPQTPLVAAMLEPQFYPKRVDAVEHSETHISHLFFAGDLVYKVKKSVRFSFLDYSTLNRRRYFLQEELRLNRRLAPSVYLGILPISRANGGWQLGSDVAPVEYTLVMRRLPATRMLDFLLDHDQATAPMMGSLAELLAAFHADAPTGGKIDLRGDPGVVSRVWKDNLADLRPFIRGRENEEKFTALELFGDRFVAEHRDLMVRRIGAGRIREGHGDLHCEHICFAPEGIQIFDCVEFSSKLRRCDVASEVAFLLMDTECRGGAELAGAFLRRYIDLTGDRELPTLLPFYQSYRAVVRSKVNALRSGDLSPLAYRYFEYACRCARVPSRPFLVLLGGLSGTGKSTLARELGRLTGLPIISSDRVRTELFKVPGKSRRTSYEEGIYSPQNRDTTYERIALEAERLLAINKGAILDATFQNERHRERMIRLAAEHQVPVVVIWCHSAEEVIRRRLVERARQGRDWSDADWEIYLKQKAAHEPIAEAVPYPCLSLNTDASVPVLGRKVERFLNERLAAEN